MCEPVASVELSIGAFFTLKTNNIDTLYDTNYNESSEENVTLVKDVVEGEAEQ